MGCDNLIDGAQVLQQFEVPLDKETIPLPMDVSGTKERLGDVVTKVGQNIKEAQDPPEATSPHKSSSRPKFMQQTKLNRQVREQ